MTSADLPDIPLETRPATALRVLMTHLVDYAGLFPPATLNMGPAVGNYAAYLGHADAWMLGRIIIPVKRIDEFEEAAADLLPRHDDLEPWLLSGLPSPASDLDAYRADIERIDAFNERHATAEEGLAGIDIIEVRAGSAAEIEAALEATPDEIFPFFEIPVTDDPRGLVAALAGSDAGAKIRTGGVTADLFPTSEMVARFLRACAAGEVAFKATAGLHHPVRQYAESVRTEMHGFLNVFVAATLAHAMPDIAESALLDVLNITDGAEFVVDDDGITAAGHHASVQDLEAAREAFAVSYGSCSFDEPREDLQQLGLLPT